MLQSFIIFWREGFESFLIVAIILTYLQKTDRRWLRPAVFAGIGASIVASAALGGVLMKGVNQALWEGILGFVAVAMVGTLVIHMWRTAPLLKPSMEKRLLEVSSRRSRWSAWIGVFFFTMFMITREGMETALMILQVRNSRFFAGLILGTAAAAAMSWAWVKFGHLIDLKRFFRVTGIFLLLFMAQIAIYSFHELSEAGVIPNSEAIHEATEPLSPYGTYGKWFPSVILLICGVWLTGAWLLDRQRRSRGALAVGALVLGGMVIAGSAEADPERTTEELAAQVDSLAAELGRRVDILAREIEGMTLGEAATASKSAAPRGLGRSAGKVYGVDHGVSIGGYGEMLYQNFAEERDDNIPSGKTSELDFLRAVLYVGYKFSDRWLFNSEIEFEHANTDKGGEVAVEFAYIDALWRPQVNLRAGLVLLPVGLINELHEPTVFLGARRPAVERSIIPTTWRENGVGMYGDAGPLSYRTYVVNGLDASGFSAEEGIREGRQEGAETKAHDLAWVGRLDLVEVPGLLAGGSVYTGNSGQGLTGAGGGEIAARTTLVEGHGEWKWQGLELRGLGAQVTIDDVAALNAAHPDSLTGAESIGEKLIGGYVQVGYDLMSRWPHGEQALVPFVRWEKLNIQDEVPAGFSSDPSNDAEILTVGATYRPIDSVVIKADYQNLRNEAESATDQFNAALGYIF